jgi:hypothetical protein
MEGIGMYEVFKGERLQEAYWILGVMMIVMT